MSPQAALAARLSIAASLAFALATPMLTSPTHAQTGTRVMVAELAAPANQTNVVAGGVVWRCEGSRCTAPVNGARAQRACREVNRKLGQIIRFENAGTELSAEELARCNS